MKNSFIDLIRKFQQECHNRNCEDCELYNQCNRNILYYNLYDIQSNIPLISSLDYYTLKNIDNEFLYYYLCRDGEGDLFLYENIPNRVGDIWFTDKENIGKIYRFKEFNDSFKNIQWDTMPIQIIDYINAYEKTYEEKIDDE